MAEPQTILQRLMDVIVDRKQTRPPRSYTVRLLDGGYEAIGTKIREEADELIEAAQNTEHDGRQPIIHEAADLVYHLLVMLGYCDIALAEVEQELAKRFGTSGMDEKASRQGTENS